MILALALYGYPPIRIAHLPIQIMTPTHKLSAIHYPRLTLSRLTLLSHLPPDLFPVPASPVTQ
jgi:hypothetical protein